MSGPPNLFGMPLPVRAPTHRAHPQGVFSRIRTRRPAIPWRGPSKTRALLLTLTVNVLHLVQTRDGSSLAGLGGAMAGVDIATPGKRPRYDTTGGDLLMAGPMPYGMGMPSGIPMPGPMQLDPSPAMGGEGGGDSTDDEEETRKLYSNATSAAIESALVTGDDAQEWLQVVILADGSEKYVMDRDILQSWLSAATREVHHLYYLEGGEKTSFKVAAIINIGAKGAKQLLELAEHGHKGIKAMTMKGAMTIPAFAARFDGMLIVGIEISVQGLNLTSKIHLRELGKVLAANLNKPVADTGKTGMVIRAEQLLKGKHITPAEAETAKGATITCLQLEAVSTIGGIGVANTSNTKNRFILMLEFADEDGNKFTPKFFVQFLPVPVSASVEVSGGAIRAIPPP